MGSTKEKFIYWVEERERIRALKILESPKPWSDDPVFQTTYFCNADREHDKVTKALRAMYGTHSSHPVANYMMARMVNKPESLQRLGWPWSIPDSYAWDVWYAVMSQQGAWGSAYIVSTNGRAMPKHEYIAGLLEQAFERFAGGVGASVPPTLRGWHTAIQGLQGMGSFMAAQVVADLKNTTGHPLVNAEDWHTWAAHGPGSLRGLTWFHHDNLDGPNITSSRFTEALVSARQWCNNSGHSKAIGHLCNQNLQNCFCEFDKYMRVSTGTGRSKRKYDGK